MLKRVSSRLGGAELVFAPSGNGRWSCAVPAAADGSYVVELTAEDEAGNQAYYATVLFTVDTSRLCITVEWLELSAGAEMDAMAGSAVADGFSADAEMDTVESSAAMIDYAVDVLCCEICGRW